MLSQTAATLILAGLIIFLIRTRWLRFSAAVLCATFGVCLGVGPVGPAISDALGGFGTWAFQSLQAL